MAQPCRQGIREDGGRRWVRELTEAVTGWGQGELDRALPDPDDDLPPELIELRAGLELTRRALRAERAGQLTRLSDGLTSLPNREHFTGLVRRMVARLGRHGGSATLLLLDLDNFRNINRELGHEAGDVLLGAVGGRLTEIVRAADAVARLGGDEFAVLLEGTSLAGAERLAQRVLAAISEPFSLLGHEVTMTASIGLALVDPAAGDAAEMLRRGDVAMYVAKQAGKARWAAFDPAMDETSRGRLRLESELRQAARRGELRLYYQPVFSLPEGEVTTLEALLRWEHPTRGLLAPEAFMDLAEETGLILSVGEWVLDEAVTQQARLRARFDGSVGIPVQVNVSARQFRDPSFFRTVSTYLDRWDIPPGGFGIEITETVVLEETDRTVSLLSGLRRLGAVISLDDFGIGYSSLTYLRQFPLDVLKLDRSFIQHITDEVESRAVVKAVIRLGHELGLTVVAEGVEDEEQLRWLCEWGCDAAQGYLLARPMPVHRLDDFLDQARLSS